MEKSLDCLPFSAILLIVLKVAQCLSAGDLLSREVVWVIGDSILHLLIDFFRDFFRHGSVGIDHQWCRICCKVAQGIFCQIQRLVFDIIYTAEHQAPIPGDAVVLPHGGLVQIVQGWLFF